MRLPIVMSSDSDEVSVAARAPTMGVKTLSACGSVSSGTSTSARPSSRWATSWMTAPRKFLIKGKITVPLESLILDVCDSSEVKRVQLSRLGVA